MAAIAAVVLVVLLRRGGGEPAWELRVEANRAIGAPWTAFELVARVQATGSGASVSSEGWSWRWQADGIDLAANEARVTWRTRREGRHRLRVTARSTGGTEKSAEVELTVRIPAVVDELAAGTTPRPEPVDPSVHDVRFGFEDVIVEKSEVCVGEPSLIRTIATSTAGPPGNLITAIAGMPGSAGSFLRFDGEPGMRRVTMTLRDPFVPDKFAEEEVYIELKDCYAPATLVVEATPDQMVPDRYAFIAKLLKLEKDNPPTRLADVATSYSWDFGDGETEVTEGFETGHVFPSESERSSSDHFQTYVVTVEALDRDGNRLAKGYETVFIYNLRRQSKDNQGIIELVANFRDIAETDEQGNKSMPVTLVNIDAEETVGLIEVQLRELGCDGEIANEETVAAITLFPETRIGPGKSVEGTLTVEAPAARNVCRVFAAVTGKSSPGSLDAVGSFALTVGEAFRQPITDEQQLEVIKQVTAILGKASFTDEDVRRLEDEGKIPRGVLRPAAPPKE